MGRKGRENLAALVGGLGEGLKTAGIVYATYKQQEDDKEILQKVQDPNISPLKKAELVASLSVNGQKTLSNTLNLQQKILREEELRENRKRDEENRNLREEERMTKFFEQQALKESREARLSRKDMQEQYKTRLKHLNEDFKEARTQKERDQIKQEKDLIARELGVNIHRMKSGQDPIYRYLTPQDTSEYETTASPFGGQNLLGAGQQPQEAQQEMPQQSRMMPQEQAPQRVRWNPQDPEHQARALEVLKSVGGNRQEATQLLSEIFER
ncbi:MAG: hypothetical protein JSR46_09940 [Verrucomicrobia bacterium]|nr:hypothetical protein [Verrucomicrobiota bacterium]